MTLQIENTDERFRVHVISSIGIEIFACGWHGGEFEYNGKWYSVFGPYHGLDGDKFRLYELVPIGEPT